MNAVDNNIWTKLQSEAEDYIKSNEDYKDFLESLVLSNDDFISSLALNYPEIYLRHGLSEKKLFPSILQALNTKDVSKAIEKILMQLFQRSRNKYHFGDILIFKRILSFANTGPLIIIGRKKLFILFSTKQNLASLWRRYSSCSYYWKRNNA